jgi:hypothetical protein
VEVRMKKFLLALIVLLLVPFSLKADTLGQMIVELRFRIAETDTATSFFTDSGLTYYLNHAQDKQVRMANYIPKAANIIFYKDTNSYALPASFKYETGVMVRTGSMWEGVVKNPTFNIDTDRFSYDTKFHTSDSARLYLEGRDLYDGDTVRVFYNGSAARLTAVGDSCEVARDLHVRIIEEAITMCEQAKRAWASQKLLWEQLRLDLGVIQPQPQEQSQR